MNSFKKIWRRGGYYQSLFLSNISSENEDSVPAWFYKELSSSRNSKVEVA
jgi:hypothetical protein